MTRATSSGARRTRCPRCTRPVLRQLVGRRAAKDVTADAERLTPADAAAGRGPMRLDWCLRATPGGIDLRWTTGDHSRCPHPHVLDHQCAAPPATPAPRTARQGEQLTF
ncbi:hypothetical protein [Streptomyces chumphonensis]|uniref:hypothetical protein n=1 Tax=Streptomyces chumphonensis TaxID=1214925 RepID=UPI003D74017D